MNSITLNRVWAIIVAAALLSLALYAGSQAQAAAPMISNISATTTSTGATVMWTTDEAADSQVVYGTSTPYSATSTLNTGTTTSHSVALSGLTPATLYHYAVISMGSTSTSSNMSGDNTFMTTSSTSTATSTAAVTLSVSSGAPGTLVTVTGSGFMAAEPITLMWNGTSTSLTADTAGGFSTTLTVPSVAIGPLPVSATGGTSGRIAMNSFSVTTGAITGSLTGTITSTTTDLTALQNRVAILENQVSTMQTQISALQSQFAMHMTGHSTTTGSMPTGPARIDQNGRSLSLGTSIDFGGHNFGLEETVLVVLNGQTVATAHADGGGNFSTGSMSTPSAVGMYTYQFTGQNSGRTASATITVTP